MHEGYGAISFYPISGHIGDSVSKISVQDSGGESSAQWQTGDTWIGFSGCYLKS